MSNHRILLSMSAVVGVLAALMWMAMPPASTDTEKECHLIGFAFLIEDPQATLTGPAKMMYKCNGEIEFREIENGERTERQRR